jgi:hypothetical protein
VQYFYKNFNLNEFLPLCYKLNLNQTERLAVLGDEKDEVKCENFQRENIFINPLIERGKKNLNIFVNSIDFMIYSKHQK